MIEMFKLNEEIYCKLFAWTPVRTTSNDRQWIWFDYYYLRMARNSRRAIIMTYDEFQTDYNCRC